MARNLRGEKDSIVNLILLGPPCSGKGTQAKFIETAYNLKQVSTGELFRNAVNEKTELGDKVKKYLTNGNLVPDDLTLNIVLESMRQVKNSSKGFIFDGFPRTLPQAQGLQDKGVEIELVVNFIIDVSQVLERLSSRRICSVCKKEYNIKFSPPKIVDVCDKCQGKLTTRKDDTPIIIKKRMEDYTLVTQKLITYYRNQKILYDIDAGLPIEEVRLEIKNI